jgi:ribosomal protein S18 acetylase RimI-like enzyme
MMSVLQLAKRIDSPPAIPAVENIRVRNYRGAEDIDAWLDLRHRAFARLKVGVRRWERADFAREFLAKPWWSPGRLWFAESLLAEDGCRPVGTVALAQRAAGMPAVHWLAVDPRWRRRGIARLLMAHLEASCWDSGQRQLWLETHSSWEAANALYRSLGFGESEPANPGAS